MENRPLFSIIVPVYNVEQYLEQCLQSIVNQSFKDFELILVDDGSPDNCPQICDDYAQKYDFVAVYHKRNGGISSARNYGIGRANGKYIVFVDSDDWISECFLKDIFDILSDTEYDMVFWPYVQEFSNQSIEKHLYTGNKVFDKDACVKLRCNVIGPLQGERFSPQTLDRFSAAWSKLYKAEIIKANSLEFVDTGIIGTFEDGLFNFQYMKYISNAYYADRCYYHYRKTNATSLTSKVRLDLFPKWDNLYSIIDNDIKDEGLDFSFRYALQNRIAISTFFWCQKQRQAILKKKKN